MKRSATDAVRHALDGLALFEEAVGAMSVDDLSRDRIRRAAAERAILIVSEASRSIPDAWKASEPGIPWKEIAGIGNIIRHDYDAVSLAELVDLRESGHSLRLGAALARLLARDG